MFTALILSPKFDGLNCGAVALVPAPLMETIASVATSAAKDAVGRMKVARFRFIRDSFRWPRVVD